MPKQPTKRTKAPPVGGKPLLLRAVRGMADILPKDEEWWQFVLRTGEHVAELHDFHLIETPIVEPAALFEKTVGAATDIVEKQMYTFKTKGDDRVALRPEGTAPVMRAYLEHHLGYFASPLKVYYTGPMFRYERPQAGRGRQFHQWGFEIVGDGDPVYDGEAILVTLDFLKALHFRRLTVKVNTIGCKVCRPTYREKLRAYYRARKDKLCEDCARRLDVNPLRLLDCAESECRALREHAPIILDYLCRGCNNHFKAVLELVEDNGVLYQPDPYLVRGLDYYNRTVFEIFAAAHPNALAGGGRYDYLSEALAGRLVPAVGSAVGLERVIETLRLEGVNLSTKGKPSVFFAAVGDQAKKASLRFMRELRASGIIVIEALGKRSLKAQLKAADRRASALALIFGQREVFEGSVIIRDMATGAQETVVVGKLVEEVKKRLR